MRPFEGAGAALKLSQMAATPFMFDPNQNLSLSRGLIGGNKPEFGRGLSFSHANQYEHQRGLDRRLSMGGFQLPDPLEQNVNAQLSTGRISQKSQDRRMGQFDAEKGTLPSIRDYLGFPDSVRAPSAGGYHGASDLAISGGTEERNIPLIPPMMENGIDNATKLRRHLLNSGSQGLLYQGD